jgi:leader peptidase (prepilin peptidase) / N-methyltransferase
VSPELIVLRPYWVTFAAVLGALLGSFLNVCILRWGAEPKQSVVRPRSRCPRCGKALAWYENIPVFSWIFLRGRCSGCGIPISIQYPLIELATAAIWGYAAWRQGISLDALRAAVFGTLLLGIAMTDARQFIIPHEFSLGGSVLGVLLWGLSEPASALVSIQGALVGAGAVLLIGEMSELAVGQEAMGGGDCALMGMIGAFLGWEAILPVLLVGAVISTIIYVFAAIRRGSQLPPSSPEAPIEPAHLGPEAVAAERGGFRWGMVTRLFTMGLLPILLLLGSVQLHLIGGVMTALFHALLAAGLAYYASFLLPERAEGQWVRVRGLLAASLGIALGSGLVLPRVVAGLALTIAVVWYLRRVRVTPSPETAEGLEAEGYLPFGVGLAIAAGVVELSGAMPFLRDVVLEYGRMLRLA